MIIEFICGYLAGSLAIMSDATHLLSDLAGFLISLFSLYLALAIAASSIYFLISSLLLFYLNSRFLALFILTIVPTVSQQNLELIECPRAVIKVVGRII